MSRIPQNSKRQLQLEDIFPSDQSKSVINDSWFDKIILHPPKINMDTQTDGSEKVTPFKYGHFGYLW